MELYANYEYSNGKLTKQVDDFMFTCLVTCFDDLTDRFGCLSPN